MSQVGLSASGTVPNKRVVFGDVSVRPFYRAHATATRLRAIAAMLATIFAAISVVAQEVASKAVYYDREAVGVAVPVLTWAKNNPWRGRARGQSTGQDRATGTPGCQYTTATVTSASNRLNDHPHQLLRVANSVLKVMDDCRRQFFCFRGVLSD